MKEHARNRDACRLKIKINSKNVLCINIERDRVGRGAREKSRKLMEKNSRYERAWYKINNLLQSARGVHYQAETENADR